MSKKLKRAEKICFQGRCDVHGKGIIREGREETDNSYVQKPVQGNKQVSERKGPRETALTAKATDTAFVALSTRGPTTKGLGAASAPGSIRRGQRPICWPLR